MGWHASSTVPQDGLPPQPFIQIKAGFVCKHCPWFKSNYTDDLFDHATEKLHLGHFWDTTKRVHLQSWTGDFKTGSWIVQCEGEPTEAEKRTWEPKQDQNDHSIAEAIVTEAMKGSETSEEDWVLVDSD